MHSPAYAAGVVLADETAPEIRVDMRSLLAAVA
jgi:hypothetical protein